MYIALGLICLRVYTVLFNKAPRISGGDSMLEKSDVYSFGMTMLKSIFHYRAANYQSHRGGSLLSFVRVTTRTYHYNIDIFSNNKSLKKNTFGIFIK